MYRRAEKRDRKRKEEEKEEKEEEEKINRGKVGANRWSRIKKKQMSIVVRSEDIDPFVCLLEEDIHRHKE